MDFANWISTIWTTITDFLNFLLELPQFIIDFLYIFPNDIQIIILSALTILSILLVYRFIK